MIGPIMRHGAHHSAQQSNNTGLPVACSTSVVKLASVTSIGLFPVPLLVAAVSESFVPQRPHFASFAANRPSSARFLVPHLLQVTICIAHRFHFLKNNPSLQSQNRRIISVPVHLTDV